MKTIRYDVESPVGVITLNRPDRRNAINPVMVAELTEAARAAEVDPRCRVILLRAEGSAFCAGLDLADLERMMEQSYEANLEDSRQAAALFDFIWSFPKPVVSAVQGAALGGGCGLASICDVTLAAVDATFGFPEVRVGFVPAIVSVFLVRLVGHSTARDLLMTGRSLTAAEAVRLGLAAEAVPRAALDGRARQWAENLAANSAQAMAATRRLLPAIPRDELERACVANATARTTDDCREGIRAFLEKRQPSWVRAT
jgi:methylglutaconyl-CoA hydratase